MIEFLRMQPNLLEKIQYLDNQTQSLCWFFNSANIKNQSYHANYYYRARYDNAFKMSEEFIDPKINLIGFTIVQDLLAPQIGNAGTRVMSE